MKPLEDFEMTTEAGIQFHLSTMLIKKECLWCSVLTKGRRRGELFRCSFPGLGWGRKTERKCHLEAKVGLAAQVPVTTPAKFWTCSSEQIWVD